MRLPGLLCVTLLQAVWAAGPPQAQLLEEANQHYRAMRSEDAVRLYREYLSRYADRADVRVFLGGALLNLNRLDDAAEEAQSALRLDPRYGKAYTLLGRVYAARENWGSAEQNLTKALSLDPGDRETWYFSGRAAYEAGRFGIAIERFRRAIQLGAVQSRVFENLGLALEAETQFAAAEAMYRRAVELAEGAYRPHLAYGRFLFKQGRTSESLPLLREALRIHPDEVEVRMELGRALYQAGKFEEALTVLRGATPTDDCRVHNLLVKILSIKSDRAELDNEMAILRACVSKSAGR